VPAYAGIPVTHRGLATSVTIVTGHEAPDKGRGAATVDWARLATATDTLVILMGVSTLPAIAAQLIAHGRAAETPAAVVEQGTTSYQRVIAGTLADLPALAADAQVCSPATIVVGEVVRLQQALAWFAPPVEARDEADLAAPVPSAAD
jgi:siroheme synthase